MKITIVWDEIGVIVIPLFLQRTSRMKQRLQPKATWVDVSEGVCIVVLYWFVSAARVCVCERSSFLSTYSSNIIGVAWRVPGP